MVLLAACAGDDGDDTIDPSMLNACSASDYIVHVLTLAAAMDASDAPGAVAASSGLLQDLGHLVSAPGCFSQSAPPSGTLTADCTPARCTFTVTTSSPDGDFPFRGEIVRADDELTISVYRQLSATAVAPIGTEGHTSLRGPMTGHASYNSENLNGLISVLDHAGVEVEASGCPISGDFDVTLYKSAAADPTSSKGSLKLGPACAR